MSEPGDQIHFWPSLLDTEHKRVDITGKIIIEKYVYIWRWPHKLIGSKSVAPLGGLTWRLVRRHPVIWWGEVFFV